MGIRIFAAGHLATTERHGREVPITANAENAAEEARAKAARDLLGTRYGEPAQAALRFGLACPLLSTIEVGIGETHLEKLASDAMKQQRLLVNNPRALGEADALAIYRAAW